MVFYEPGEIVVTNEIAHTEGPKVINPGTLCKLVSSNTNSLPDGMLERVWQLETISGECLHAYGCVQGVHFKKLDVLVRVLNA